MACATSLYKTEYQFRMLSDSWSISVTQVLQAFGANDHFRMVSDSYQIAAAQMLKVIGAKDPYGSYISKKRFLCMNLG